MGKFWILSGTEGNWDIAFKENKWGARVNLKLRWNQLTPGDILVFYVTAPISGIIGFGRLTRKAEEKTPYWPDEIRQKRAIWPFRFYFDVIHKLPDSDWKEKRVIIRDFKLTYRSGINRVANKEIIPLLLERANKVWDVNLTNFTNKIALKEEKDKYFYGDLVKNEELEKIARERKKKYKEETIPKELKEVYLKEGWEVKKEYKNKLRMTKGKEYDELLEDEAWLLFKNMGFAELNKNRKFKIRAGSILKQIDVFARDKDSIFIIECKASKAKNGSRDLLPTIHEILNLKKYIIESTRKHYNGNFIFSFLLITRNIKWTPNAQRFASDSRNKGFFFWRETDLEAFMNLANQFGEAAKFQMFSILFPGKKFSELKDIQVPAILAGTGDKFYTFVIQPAKLLRVAYVHRREESSPKEVSETYQRMIKKSRLREICDFIENGGHFPNNIILNFTEEPTFEKKGEVGDINYGVLKFPPYYKSAWVIDGQHRLYGYLGTEKKETASLPVVAFVRLGVKKQANLFVEINKKQVPVSSSLLWDLYPDIYSGSDDPKQQYLSSISLIAKKLNFEPSSPLYNNIEIPSSPIKNKEVANVTLTNICDGIKENRLVNKGDLLYKTDYEHTVDFAYKRLRTYFDVIAKFFPQDWEKGDRGLLRTNVGIRIFLIIFRQLLKYLDYKGMKGIYIRENLSGFENKAKEIVGPLLNEVIKMSDSERDQIRKDSTKDKVMMNTQRLVWNLKEEFNFGVELWFKGGWVPPIPSEEDNEERIKNLIKDTQTKSKEFLIRELKKIHGEREWWLVGVPEGVKQRISDKIKQELKRSPYKKEIISAYTNEKRFINYSSTSDLKEVIRMKNNSKKLSRIFGDMEYSSSQFKSLEILRNAYIGHEEEGRKEDIDEIEKKLGYWGTKWIRRCIGLNGTGK